MDKTRSRAWCWTVFVEQGIYNIEDKCSIENIKYYIYQVERCKTTGKEHLQGYMVLHESVTLKTAKKILGFETAHLEVRRGTHEQAVEYCQKLESRVESFKPVEFGEFRQGKRNDIHKAKEMVLAGKSMREITLETEGYQAARYAELLLKYHEKPRCQKPEVFWYWGDTGSGKTKAAMDESEPAERWISMKNLRWFEGYDGHKHAIFDEFRGDFCTFHELLRILDRYECRVEVKGGSRQFVATKIWITSCYPPDRVYQSREDIGQLLRRIDKIVKFENCPEVQNLDDNNIAAFA